MNAKEKGERHQIKKWYNPLNSDAKIVKTKAGATDMIFKPEHGAVLDTGAILDADILLGDCPDS